MMKVFILLTLIYFVMADEDLFSFSARLLGQMQQGALHSVEYMYDTLSGLSFDCPVAQDVVKSLNTSLNREIKSQNRAISSIANSFAAREMQREKIPLVLSFHGPTGTGASSLVIVVTNVAGVGKSETAYLIAKNYFSKAQRVGSSTHQVPCCLLSLRGEDFAPGSEAAEKGLAEVHSRIRTAVVEMIKKCNGNIVVIFDEVQKVELPGALEVLVPAMSEHGSLTVYDPSAPEYKRSTTYSTEKAIFIFTSDTGQERILSLLMEYGDRDLIPQDKLRKAVLSALDVQWGRKSFSKFVKEIIPFLPLESPHIKEICQLKLFHLSEDNRGKLWLDLIVDDSLITWIASKVEYSTFKKQVVSDSSQQTLEVFKSWSKFGARNLDNAGPLSDIRTLIFELTREGKKDQIFHLGMISKDAWNVELEKNWGRSGINDWQVYGQWCIPTADMLLSTDSQPGVVGRSDRYQITREISISNHCETIYLDKWQLQRQ